MCSGAARGDEMPATFSPVSLLRTLALAACSHGTYSNSCSLKEANFVSFQYKCLSILCHLNHVYSLDPEESTADSQCQAT
jgi:hypothetical protein